MNEPDDEHWIEALRGGNPEGADPMTLREARAVRNGLRDAMPASLSDQEVDQGLNQLLFRLRREGLLQSGVSRWMRQPMAWMSMTAIAAAVVLSVSVVLLRPELEGSRALDETMFLRGGGAQTVRSPDPQALAFRIKGELAAFGIPAAVRQEGPVWVLDARVGTRATAAVRDWLRKNQLKVDGEGRLLLTIRPGGTEGSDRGADR